VTFIIFILIIVLILLYAVSHILPIGEIIPFAVFVGLSLTLSVHLQRRREQKELKK